ncbi:MAG TPA: hypothetical protein VGS19_01135, partial [Streptosporangiaceae bacterium]|nr:hypothetical protein [Streptosporangiaceae bacterium]
MGWVRRIRDWSALRLAAECLLGVAAAGGLLCTSAAPAAASGAKAPASCMTTHQNVEGDDNGPGQAAYGNQAMIATNSQGTLNGTHAQVSRSLFIWFSPGNDVEVGWATGGAPMN